MFRLVGAGVLGLALLLTIVAVATPAWIVAQVAVGTPEGVAIAFNVLAILTMIVAIALAIRGHMQKTEGTQGQMGGSAGISAGVMILIAVGNYTRFYAYVSSISSVSWGYSFGICWASCALALLGGALAMKTN